MRQRTLNAIVMATMPLRTSIGHDLVEPDFSTDIATIKFDLYKEEKIKEIVRQIVRPKIDINIKQR